MITYVVPDANVLFSDPLMERPLMRTILAAENTADLRFLLPAVVVDELRHHLEEKLNDPAGKAEKLQREISDLMGLSPKVVGFQLAEEDKQAILDRFNRRVEQFSREGRILDYPDVPLKELAFRSIQSKRPFLKRDRGFRDTLIWLSLRQHLTNAPDPPAAVILVTDDGGFYNFEGTGVSEDLKGDFDSPDSWRGTLIAVRKLQNVINDNIGTNLTYSDWAGVMVKSGTADVFRNDVEHIVQVANDWIIEHVRDFEDDFRVIASKYSIIGLDLLETATLTKVNQTLELGNDQVLVDSEWIGPLSILLDDLPLFGDREGCVGDYLGVSMKFCLSSLIELTSGQQSILSHEITSMSMGIMRSRMDHAVGS